MKVITTKLEYTYPYTHPYEPDSYSLNQLIESKKEIAEPIKSILNLINEYHIDVKINNGVTLVGEYKNEDAAYYGVDEYYNYTLYTVKFQSKQYQVKIGVYGKDAWLMKAEIKTNTVVQNK
jgi:hypothetical protein